MSSGRRGPEDEDGLFLQRVLDSLYDFGPKPKRKCQKNNSRRRSEEDEELPTETSSCRDAEGCEAAGAHEETKGPTGQQVEVVTFQDPSKKPTTPTVSNKMPAPRTSEQEQNGHGEQLSLEKARLEVHRFGITGYKKEQQRVFEQDRAVMLGARPPKKDYVNYKVLQQQLKQKKQKQKEEFQPDKKKKRSSQRDKKRPSSSGSGSSSTPLGQVGRFKKGVLVLSSKEIQKIKGKK